MNKVIPRLLVCICLLLTYTLSAQTILNTSNSGEKFFSCEGTYQDDGGNSIYASSYDTNNDNNPDFLCWTFCPTHPINEGVRLVFQEWDVVDPGDIFRIRDGKIGACDHVTSAGLSPLIGGNSFGFTGTAASGFDGSAGGTYAFGGGGWIEASPSNESGCLTVEFRPDGDGDKGTGFTIAVECIKEGEPSDLFISEYYSDCDDNLYVELYNPTDAAIKLNGTNNEDVFTLRRQNGTTYGTGSYEVNLIGTVEPHSTFVVCKRNSNSTITRSCDQSVNPFGNNGNLFPWIKCNEAFGLFQNGHVIDVVGDATTAASGNGLTVAGIIDISKDYTLIRKKSVTKGNPIWSSSAGTNESNSEWLLIPNGNFKNLGKHIFGDQGIFISEFSGHDANYAYIEIHNRTNAVYDLSNIDVILAKNDQDWGATAPNGTPAYSGGWTQASASPHMLSLQGLLYPGAVYVISNTGSSPSIQCQSDLILSRSNGAGQSTLQLINGNDAIGIFMNHVLVDVVGIPGSNRAHTVARNSSATDRFTIVRNSNIRVGNCDFADSSAGRGEWKLHDLEEYSLLGAHNQAVESCFQNLLISEYMNSDYTTAIGITNKSTSTINLSQFSLKMATDGQGWGTQDIEFPTNTMLSPNQEFVVYQTTEADPFSEVSNSLKMKTTHFIKSDGNKYLDLDDAVGLYQNNGELLDIVGDQNSSNNGVGYRVAGINNALSSNTLRRKSTVEFGNMEPMASFGTFKNNSEWLVINNRNIENFGMATLVDEIPSITYDLFVETGAACEGATAATVNLELLGGTAPFAIQVDGQDVIDGTIDLLNGAYLLSIVDAYGIRYNTPIEIDAPLSPAISAIIQTLQAPSCGSSADASATIVSEDAALTYLWTDGSTGATNNQLTAGNHTVTVTNQLGCENILEVTIEAGPSSGVNAAVQMMQATSCAGNADAVASVTSTETNLSYAWSDGVTTATNNQLAAGSHSVTVTNQLGCENILEVTIEAGSGLSAAVQMMQATSCAGNADAVATVTSTETNLSYAWSNGVTTATNSQLAAGSHSVTVTNQSGCENILEVTIEAGAGLSAVVQMMQAASCNADAIASVTSTETNLSYAWSNGVTTATNSQLATGSHLVTVTNIAGCSQVLGVNIDAPSAITATASLTKDLACATANDASASVNATGGTGTYQYAWSNGSTTATVNNLGAGTHTVTVTDNNACATVSTIIVAEPTGMSLQAALTQPSCSQNTGSIQVTPVGGTGPYQYNWNSAGFVVEQSTLSNITSGNYTVEIRDNNGCTYSESFVLETPASIEASIQNITSTTCIGSNNGQAQIVSNQADATIVWDNGIVGNLNTQLSTGNHTVTIRNNEGCSQTIEFTIEDAPAIIASINLTKGLSCFGEVGAAATISAQGGSGKYEFHWSNGAIGTMTNNLQAGTYTVTILDEVGCSTTNTIVVEAPSSLALTATMEAPTCSTSPSGSILTTPTGGVAPYQYSWNNADYTAEASITGLSGGSHTLSIRDANGCTLTENFTLETPADLEVAIDNIAAPTCSNTNNGTAQVATTATELSFLWSDGSTAAINNNLATGNHSVTVSNAAGCSEVLRIDIPSPTLMNVVINNTQAATCSSATGGASISVTGGQGPYTYLWDNGQTTSTSTGLTAGVHQVTVVDANGCSVDYELSIDAVEEVQEALVEAIICSGTSHTTSVNSYTEPGVYTESSLSATGCDSITTIVLSVLESSSVDLGPDQIIRTGETIELFPSTTFANYEWSNGSTEPSLVIRTEDLEVGANTLFLITTDDAGCEGMDQIVIFFEQTTATIDPIILRNIRFYPNPTNGLLTVTDQNDELTETRIEAYTPQGQLVQSWNFDRLETAQLDMQHFTNSVYILKIVRAEKVGFQKVLLNR